MARRRLGNTVLTGSLGGVQSCRLPPEQACPPAHGGHDRGELHGNVGKSIPSWDATLPGLRERHDGIEVPP
jgi:hypothetical protein